MTANAQPAPTVMTDDPDLHLRAGDERIDGTRQGAVWIFPLHVPCPELRLISRAGRPDELGLNADGRRLGVCLVAITLMRGGEQQTIPLDHPALDEGLHDVEATGKRWTDGSMVLPASLLGPGEGTAELHILCSGLPRYRRDPSPDSGLFARFEALGDNCEFGLVQRHFDAEPISLLRWASTDAARLVLGLCRRFDGLGDPEATTLGWSGDPPDYMLVDHRYLSAHTWAVKLSDDPQRLEDIRLSGAARLRLLKRKLLADIETGKRIFVFKQSSPDARPEALNAVHAALRGIGPAPVLCVVRAAAPEMVGTVEALGDGVYRGHIDQFSRATISYGVWRKICAATAALVDSNAAPVANA